MIKQTFLKRLLCTTLLVTLACLVTVALDFTGEWKGSIVVQNDSIPLVLHLVQTEEGFTASLDSPEQQAYGMKVTARVNDDRLEASVPEIGASYTAKLDGNTLDGTYSQMGFSAPLKLTREVIPAAQGDDDDWVNDSLLDVFDNIQLKDVTVTSQRQLIKQEVDRIGYNVAEDADSKTNNVLTMLRKVPLVSVDANDEIRVNGQTDFKIFRNGHPDPTISRNAKDVLKAMPASAVKRIEVITEPGAKYDAEGTTLILNIVMADNSTLKGVSGMASVDADDRGTLGASLDLTTQLDKVVMAVDYGAYYSDGRGQKTTSSSLDHYQESGAELSSNGVSDGGKSLSNYLSLSASWEPDTLNLVSLSMSGYIGDYDSKGTSSSLMRDAAGQTLYSYGMNDHSDSKYYSVDTRIDYQRLTHRKGEAITLSYMLDASHDKGKSSSWYSDLFNMPVPYNGVDQNSKGDFNEHTVQIDWTRPFAEKKHVLETGAKYIYRMNRSHDMIDYLGTDEVIDMRYKHVTQVGAAYARYTFNSGPWNARVGLRYEHSYIRATYPGGTQEPYETHLNDLVPSASMRYQIDPANSLKFSYAVSIRRPSIYYLNPVVVESPTSRSFGNSNLGSVHNHSMSMTYMHVGSKFTFNVSPSFSFSNNGIGTVKWADGLVQVSTYANTLKRYSTYLSAYVQWMVHEKTRIMFNGSMGYSYYKSKEMGLKNDRLSGSVFTNVTQNLPWNLELTGYCGMWGGGTYDLYGHSKSARFFHGFGLQRSFLSEDRLTVRLSASNPFKKHMDYTTIIDKGDVTGWSSYRYIQSRIDLSVSFRFGSLQTSVKRADKSIENDDLMGGDNSGGGGSSGGGMGGGN